MVVLPVLPIFFEHTYIFTCFFLIFFFGILMKLIWGSR